ncbi:hypothetical protein [Niveibacterium sp.]|uniref:hypothetical protein n=1 Tax=Niveibacterium sp. TaxID=2017444 RepID=UPI0035AFCFA4
MKIAGRYGRFKPKAHQSDFYAKRAKREAQVRREAAGSLSAWLAHHQTCANGCGQPVAFYDNIHYALRYSGCCSAQCEQEREERMRELLTYWAVGVKGARIVGGSNFTAATMDEVFLSPTTKLAGWKKHAMLDSSELAQAFADALKDVIAKRQGVPVALRVVEMQVGGSSNAYSGETSRPFWLKPATCSGSN